MMIGTERELMFGALNHTICTPKRSWIATE